MTSIKADGIEFIVMEYVPQDAGEMIGRKGLPLAGLWSMRCRWPRLAAAHAAGIVHRDLKRPTSW